MFRGYLSTTRWVRFASPNDLVCQGGVVFALEFFSCSIMPMPFSASKTNDRKLALFYKKCAERQNKAVLPVSHVYVCDIRPSCVCDVSHSALYVVDLSLSHSAVDGSTWMQTRW